MEVDRVYFTGTTVVGAVAVSEWSKSGIGRSKMLESRVDMEANDRMVSRAAL